MKKQNKNLTLSIIFQCSKNYSSPTCVTRLKIAPNIADPTSIDQKRPKP